MSIEVEVVIAWPRRHEVSRVSLAPGATVDDAVASAALPGSAEATALAVYGRLVRGDALVRHGDRVELLRPLQLDPKEARRRRAARLPG